MGLKESLSQVGVTIDKNSKLDPISFIQDEVNTDKRVYGLTEDDMEIAIKSYLIPEAYRNATYDKEKVKKNIEDTVERNQVVMNFEAYNRVLNTILTDLSLKRLPKSSYLIGAPNGFGKTSFVNECIVRCMKNGWITVPYISLSELDSLRVSSEKKILKPFFETRDNSIDGQFSMLKEYEEKIPIEIHDRFSWSEYMNAKCLFCYFTSVSSRDLESRALYHIMNVRSVKGLPTIVMISTALQPYLVGTLRDQVWDEILYYGNEEECGYGRLKRVSTYKKASNDL